MSEKHIEELIVEFIEGDCPDSRMQELLDWVKQSPENRALLFGMKDIYDRSRLSARMTEEQIDAGWRRLVAECGIPEVETSAVNYPAPSPRPRPARWRRIGIAALSAAAVLALALILPHVTLPGGRTQEELIVCSNDTGERSHLVLPDGSAVWLNYGATLSYPRDFEPNRREVRLTGEAFFDIVADRTRPFVVNSELLEVEVLGTRFDMTASDGEAQVVLESGSVNLGRLDRGRVVRQVLLRPGELAAVTDRDDAIAVEEVDLQLYVSWKDRFLNIRSQRLSDVARMLAKRYHTSIAVDDTTLGEERFSGRFDQTRPLEELFAVIGLMMEVDYRYDGEKWILSPKNS